MPIFLAFIGIVLIVTGIRGRADDLFPQLKDDARGFVPLFSVVVLAALFGEIKNMRSISTAFLVLIVAAYGLRSANNIIAGFNAIIEESKT